MAHDLEQLKQDHPDVAKLFADDWLQYCKSEIFAGTYARGAVHVRPHQSHLL